MALKVRECCSGCSLQTGTIIIAIFLLVCSVMITLSASGKLNYLPTHVDDEAGTYVDHRIQYGELHKAVRVTFIVVIVIGAVQSILNALLLIGVFKEKKILVIIWLVAYVVICGLYAVTLGVCFFLVPFNMPVQAILGISTGLCLYFLLVVWSFHNSPEAGYNRAQNATDVYDTENCKIKRMPLEDPF